MIFNIALDEYLSEAIIPQCGTSSLPMSSQSGGHRLLPTNKQPSKLAYDFLSNMARSSHDHMPTRLRDPGTRT